MTTVNRNNNAISPAANLLLAVTRYSLGTIDNNDLAISCQQTTDWDVFNNLVRYHRLASLIHDRLGDSTEDLFPESTNKMLKQGHKTNAMANLLLSAKAIEIFGEFQNKEIPVLQIKGLSVEQWLYDKPGLRSSGDIDLLIKHDDCSKALTCLLVMGYELVYMKDRLIPNSRLCKQFIRTQKDFVFVHSTSKVVIELHWRVAIPHSAFPMIFDDAWSTRSTFSIAGKSLQTLPQDMHVTYLCYHGTKHYWSRLFWLYDVAKLMLQNGTDWQSILSQAQHLKAEASVGLALVLTSKIFLVPIPEIITQDNHVIEAGERLSNHLYFNILTDFPDHTSHEHLSVDSVRQQRNWNNSIHPSKNQYLIEWLNYVFSPGINDWQSLKLPDNLTPLYRIWRPIRLASKALLRI
jgi:hypothetical protein